MKNERRPATKLIHAGIERTTYRETSEPIFLTSGFVYETAEAAAAAFDGTLTHYQYTRFGNPTTTALERRLADLEGAEACRVVGTGMAAVHAAMLCNLRTGDRVVASRALFGSCHWIVTNLLPRYGIESDLVDGTDLAEWKSALNRPATLVLLESPSNPMLDVLDLRVISDLAHAAGALVIVDNVFATPLLQQPLRFGADIVVYSCTKHMDGQGRALGGAILGRKQWIEETLQPFTRNTGPSLSPFNAWLILKGLETLAVRLEASCSRAERLADCIANHPAVATVRYPGRADHPQHHLAMQQMTAGGTLISLDLAGGRPAAFHFLNALQLIAISNNLGDTKSLATHPATTTHMRIGGEERAKLGIGDGVVRLSVGLEDVEDLIEDVTAALDSCIEIVRRQAAE